LLALALSMAAIESSSSTSSSVLSENSVFGISTLSSSSLVKGVSDPNEYSIGDPNSVSDPNQIVLGR
jgi:hypothetical protein